MRGVWVVLVLVVVLDVFEFVLVLVFVLVDALAKPVVVGEGRNEA
jgi:hypothetical protein